MTNDSGDRGEPVIYVCDFCGHIEVRDQVPEGGEWTCCECGTHAAWEFPPERRANAEAHAASIARGHGKGSIFRHATRVLKGSPQ